MTNNISPLVLVVDDDPGFLEVMQAKLESQGYKTLTASDGNEAIIVAQKQNPAVILMDIEMPHKDGFTAAAELATDPKTKDIPTIFVTNLNRDLTDSLAKRVSIHLSSDNYFRKDGDYNSLLRHIQSFVMA